MSGHVVWDECVRYAIYRESTGGFSVIKHFPDGNFEYLEDENGDNNFVTYEEAHEALKYWIVNEVVEI